MDAIRLVEAGQGKKDRDGFGAGGTGRAFVKVVEGEEKGTQPFEGIVLPRPGEGASTRPGAGRSPGRSSPPRSSSRRTGASGGSRTRSSSSRPSARCAST